jgi:hypothetical protein
VADAYEPWFFKEFPDAFPEDNGIKLLSEPSVTQAESSITNIAPSEINQNSNQDASDCPVIRSST